MNIIGHDKVCELSDLAATMYENNGMYELIPTKNLPLLFIFHLHNNVHSSPFCANKKILFIRVKDNNRR